MSRNASGPHEFDSHLIVESTQLKIGFIRRTFHESNGHLGYVHTGADPFRICSRLDPIHTGPVYTPLIWIRSIVVRM